MKPTDNLPARPRNSATGRPAAARGRARGPIFGIGASSGELDAFTPLLKQLPLNSGFGWVEMVGGSLTIQSAAGQGTAVCAEIPFNPEKAKI